MKQRVDVYLVEQGYFESREQAKRHIMAKNVLINDEPCIKPGDNIDTNKVTSVRIKQRCPYVSRAGLKLKKAIDKWHLNFKDKRMLDVGSSTGGFCDCALQHGAKEIVALDVGTNQLFYNLRIDPRIQVCEQTNFRTIPKDFFDQPFDIITMDVSFISSLLLIDNVYYNLKDDGIFILLIKPQFEAGREIKRNKKGVIDNLTIVNQVKDDVVSEIKNHGFKCLGVCESPIKGASGNTEFLALFSKEK